MSETKEEIKYRIVCISHLGNGGTVIDSLTVYEYDTLGKAIDDCSTMAKNASEDMENIHIETINRETCAYVTVYRELIPLISYAIHPIYYGKECVTYRSFDIEIVDEEFGSFSKGSYIVYTLNEEKDVWHPITVKNTINECVLFIDQFLHNTITFIDSTFDTIEGSKLCLPRRESSSRSRKGTILPVS